MKRFKLKAGQEAFQVVDGPCEGRRYEPGTVYTETEIPPREAKRFLAIAEDVAAQPSPAETKAKAKKENA